MGKPRFSCPYCGAAKITRMGFCPKCYRSGDALPEQSEHYRRGVEMAQKAVKEYARDLAKIK